MGFHHLALATGDLEATHRFYTEAMGFTLVHVEGADTEEPGGWLRHAFYDTGDGTVLAFMELHDERCHVSDFAISRGLGLPSWVNHLAFRAADVDDLDTARDRLIRFGHDVVAMRHNHGRAIYTEDPNGNVIEWNCTTHPFTTAERRAAVARLRDPDLPRDAPTNMEFFQATEPAASR
jgi:catechol 2,3-dioxygenase-like lactoylglutathione lyase family enzyme